MGCLKNKGACGEWVPIKRNIVFTGIAIGTVEQLAGIGETNGLAGLARVGVSVLSPEPEDRELACAGS